MLIKLICHNLWTTRKRLHYNSLYNVIVTNNNSSQLITLSASMHAYIITIQVFN